MRCIAIIPAKAKSSRLPNKNIKIFLKKPIIGRTIQILQKSRIFDQIIVSTDSKKIAKIAKKYGAVVPFLRPKKIAHKVISTRPAIKHCINFLVKKNIQFDYVCEVYAANPFLKISDLKDGKKNNKKKYFVFLLKLCLSFYRSFLLAKGFLKPLFTSNINRGLKFKKSL